jgi:hypothetical protein
MFLSAGPDTGRIVYNTFLLEKVSCPVRRFLGESMKYAYNRLLLDMTLARHCAPVLMEKKPAALFPMPSWWQRALRDGETVDGMRFLALNRWGKTAVVFAYRPQLLSRVLKTPRISRALRDLGYPASGLAARLAFLARRFLERAEFPHEVGFFLGYPPEDVFGFIRNRGAGCKVCGIWEVYDDVEKAVALFAEYAKCRETLMKHVRNGGALSAVA